MAEITHEEDLKLRLTDASREEIRKAIRHFRLPEYEEITNVGLYLDQVTRYINEYMFPLGDDMAITSSMVSNYVKRGLVSNPVHKQYSRDQIATLIAITMVKSLLSLDHISLLVQINRDYNESLNAYNYFRDELNRAFLQVFGIEKQSEIDKNETTDLQQLIHRLAIAVAHKIYLQISFTAISQFCDLSVTQKKTKEKKRKKSDESIPEETPQ